MSVFLTVVSFNNVPHAVGASQGVIHLEKLLIRLSPGERTFYSEMESENESNPIVYSIIQRATWMTASVQVRSTAVVFHLVEGARVLGTP